MPPCPIPPAIAEQGMVTFDIHDGIARGTECGGGQYVHAQAAPKLDYKFVRSHGQAKNHGWDRKQEVACARRRFGQ